MQQRAALWPELPGGFKNIAHSSKSGVIQLMHSGPDEVWSREAPQRRSGVPWGPILGSRGVVFGQKLGPEESRSDQIGWQQMFNEKFLAPTRGRVRIVKLGLELKR